MNTETSTIKQTPRIPPKMADEVIYYPDTIENDMPEGIKHFLLSVQIASTLLAFFANRKDAKIFGNLMFYYEKGNPQKFVSPDIMVCFGLETYPERVYKLWEEKIVPSVVIELASETTWFNDVSKKLAIYQNLGVEEYYIYDLEYEYLPKPLIAYKLIDGEFEEVEIEDGRILSESMNLELVDTGETLRFFNPETKGFLMTMEEMAAKLKELENK
ncbi:MAG: Uma2 family endonuclease [Aridibacter sp.]